MPRQVVPGQLGLEVIAPGQQPHDRQPRHAGNQRAHQEAAGAIADDDALRREGKIDQAAGTVKEKAEKAIDAVKETLTGKKKPC